MVCRLICCTNELSCRKLAETRGSKVQQTLHNQVRCWVKRHRLHYCTTTVLLLYYYCTTTVLLLHYCTAMVLLYDFCTTTVLLRCYYCTTTVLLLYYCTTTVLHTTAPHQASNVVDCGGECRLEAKVFRVKGFQFWLLFWSDRGLASTFGRPQTSLDSSKYP